MNQGLIHSQKIDVTQEHTIAPHQLQSLDILSANRMELEAKITAELEENPVLEMAESADLEQEETEDDLLLPPPGSPENTPYETENLDENRDDFSETLDRYLENGTDFFSGEEQTGSVFDTLSTEESLQEQLLEQLKLSDAPARLRPVAEEIIGNIGDNGYFESAAAEIAQTMQCSIETAEEALALVQTFDPPGIGARDLKECLLLQIARDPGKHDPRLPELIEKYLDDLAKNRLPQIAKAMDLPMDRLQELVTELKKLAPQPASGITPGGVVYVKPEILVEQNEDGEFEAVPVRDSTPRLRLVSRYLKMLDDPFTPEDAKSYIREKIASAQHVQSGTAHQHDPAGRGTDRGKSARFLCGGTGSVEAYDHAGDRRKDRAGRKHRQPRRRREVHADRTGTRGDAGFLFRRIPSGGRQRDLVPWDQRDHQGSRGGGRSHGAAFGQ